MTVPGISKHPNSMSSIANILQWHVGYNEGSGITNCYENCTDAPQFKRGQSLEIHCKSKIF